MTAEEFDRFCERVTWYWAKSYAHSFPHWYCIRGEVDEQDFVDAVKFIRENKADRFFFKSLYGYYDNGIYTYWTMGNPIDETTIINKALR